MANEEKNNIFKCKRCHVTFIGQEFEGHLCTHVLKGMNELEFDYYCITKDEMNREVIMIKSMDGILYYFVKREEKETDKVPYDLPLPPTFFEQPDRNTSKGNTTKSLVTTRILVIF